MINSNVNNGGIYRAFILDDSSDIRIYIPGFNNSNICPIDSDNKLNTETYKKMKDLFPKALWCLPNLEAKEHDEVHPCWVVFENGDSSRPVIVGHLGKGIKLRAGSGSNKRTDTTGGNVIVYAMFTAYYATADNWSSAENILEGGPVDAMGNILDYTKNTCAAPPELEFNEKIKITEIDVSTEYVDKEYTVTDRGGAIKVLKNHTAQDGSGRTFDEIYCIDLLVKDKKTADAFGRQYGKIQLISRSNISSIKAGDIQAWLDKYVNHVGAITPNNPECPILLIPYLQDIWGKSITTTGNGNTAAYTMYTNHDDIFKNVTYTGYTCLQPGDVLSLSGPSAEWGHIGIVYSVSGNVVTLIEQWNSMGNLKNGQQHVQNNSSSTTFTYGGTNYTVTGLARPK